MHNGVAVHIFMYGVIVEVKQPLLVLTAACMASRIAYRTPVALKVTLYVHDMNHP